MKFLSKIINLEFIPRGWLTRLGGWASMLMGVLCLLHIPVAGFVCPSTSDILRDFITGAIGIGLGRRAAGSTSTTPTP